MRTHGALTEDSRSCRVVTHDRKGREGKGREVGHPSIVGLGPRANSTRTTQPGAWMAADAAHIGGGRS